jgi:hypothetical protein
MLERLFAHHFHNLGGGHHKWFRNRAPNKSNKSEIGYKEVLLVSQTSFTHVKDKSVCTFGSALDHSLLVVHCLACLRLAALYFMQT